MPETGCPHCGENHESQARFCPATGAALVFPSGAEPRTETTSKVDRTLAEPEGLDGKTVVQPFLPESPALPGIPSLAENVDPMAQTELASHVSLLGGLGLPEAVSVIPNLTLPLPPSNRAPDTRVPEPPAASAAIPSKTAGGPDSSPKPPSGQAAPSGDAAPALGSGQSVWSLLIRAGRLYRAHFFKVLALTALFFVPGSALEALGRAWQQSLPASPVGFPWTRFSLGLGMAFLLQVTLALVLGALAILVAGHDVDGGRTWRLYPRWLLASHPRILGPVALAAALVVGGIPLLIVPGLVLALLFGWVPAVVLFERTPGKVALLRSARLVAAGPVRASLLFVVLGLVGYGTDRLAASALAGQSHLIVELASDLVALLVFPIPLLAGVLLYFDLRRTEEGLSRSHRWAAFERLRGDGTSPPSPGVLAIFRPGPAPSPRPR